MADSNGDILFRFIKQVVIVVDLFKQLTSDTDKEHAFTVFQNVGRNLESMLSTRPQLDFWKDHMHSCKPGGSLSKEKNVNSGKSKSYITSDYQPGRSTDDECNDNMSDGESDSNQGADESGSVAQDKGSIKSEITDKQNEILPTQKEIVGPEKENIQIFKTKLTSTIDPVQQKKFLKRRSLQLKTEGKHNECNDKKETDAPVDTGRRSIRKLKKGEGRASNDATPVKKRRKYKQSDNWVIKAAEKAPKLDVSSNSTKEKPSITEGASQIDQDFHLPADASNDVDGFSDGNSLDPEHIPADKTKVKALKRRPGRPRKQPIRQRPIRHHEKIIRHICKVCKRTFTHGRPFHKHLLEHGTAGVSCRFCRKTFQNEAEYLHHNCSSSNSNKKLVGKELVTHNFDTNISTKETSYFCQQCDKKFSEKMPYFEHLKRHHAGSKEVCFKCGKFLETADELESHMKEHIASAKYKCDYCQEVFEKKFAYVTHLQDHGKISCSVCDETFPLKTSLDEHYRDHHDATIPSVRDENKRRKLFKCEPCGVAFRTDKALMRHRHTTAHIDKLGDAAADHGRDYLCSSCGKSYFTKAALQRHMRYHVDVKPYTCKYCNYTCREQNNLKRHIDLHFSERNFVCEICGAAFHAKKTLETHHIYKHEDQRGFQCTECALSFKTKSSLKRHLRVHSQTRPHKCQSCGSGFNRLYNLRRHMKAVHGNDQTLPPVKRVKLLDVPPGMEYHKGPAALGLQGKPKTPAQLLEEYKNPGIESQNQSQAQFKIESKNGIVHTNQQATKPVTSGPSHFVTSQESSNIVAQAAAAVGLAKSMTEGKDVGISPGRLIYQAQSTRTPGVPVAVEMKLNATEAAQIQVELQRQQQFYQQQPMHHNQIGTSHQGHLKSHNATDTTSVNTPQFTSPLAYQAVSEHRTLNVSQDGHPVLSRLVPGNQMITPTTSTQPVIPISQQQVFHDKIKHRTTNTITDTHHAQSQILPPQSKVEQNIMQLSWSVMHQQNQTAPPIIHSQQMQATAQQAKQQSHQQLQQPQHIAAVEPLFTLPEYAQELFTPSNTVSNLAQMRELIHGTTQGNQESQNPS